MKTLEQVILDVAAHNWSSFVDKEEEAAAIAEAVRGWMEKEQECSALGSRPKIVCLCGSTRFYDEFQKANYSETMAGNIVLSVGFYPHSHNAGHGEGVGHDSKEKLALDELHKRKIDLCDEVFVLNLGGYIGSSTKSEIEYAQKRGIPIRYLEDIVTVETTAGDLIKDPEDELVKTTQKSSRAEVIMIGGRPVSTGISPAEGDDLDAMLKLHLANQRSLTNEEHQHLTQFLRSIREGDAAGGPPDQDTHKRLVNTEPLYAWANKRIEMLEAENKRIKELEAEVARLASLKSNPGCCDKAAKYDELRAKFPYLPGEEFWLLIGSHIVKRKVDEVSETLVSSGEFGLYQSDCHPTPEACKAAIQVEE